MLEDCRQACCLAEDYSRNFEMQGGCRKLYYLVEEAYSRNYQILQELKDCSLVSCRWAVLVYL